MVDWNVKGRDKRAEEVVDSPRRLFQDVAPVCFWPCGEEREMVRQSVNQMEQDRESVCRRRLRKRQPGQPSDIVYVLA
jgi:hypothetical protein